MGKIAKMTSSTAKKPSISDSISGFLSFLDQQVETAFQGSYAVLAEKSGVPEPLLSKVKKRKRAPTAKIVGRLARAMDNAAGDRLIGRFLDVVRAEAELHRASSRKISKAQLFGRFR
jgi:hypothetical protein